MRKVFLDELPRQGGIRNRIDRKKCVGHIVKFIYEEVSGYVDIIAYDKTDEMFEIRYGNKEYKINASSFLIDCKLGILLGKYNSDFKMEIGQILKDDKRDLVIIDKKKTKDKNGSIIKKYKYKCNKCGFDCGEHYKNQAYIKELWIYEGNLGNGMNGCACCHGLVTVEGINDIATTTPWMVDLGVDKEEAKKFTCQSSRKIKCQCNDCFNIVYKKISTVYNTKSISCKCGDGQSHISKYIYSVLNQLNIKFDTEVKYGWNKYINPKNNKLTQASIDFVIYYNSREIPLEADGGFHRTDNSMNGQTKEQSEYIDKQRDDNCLKYLGEETIRISDEGDVKENILNSKLNELFDLSSIDWLKCEEFALKNLVKEVCEYWNNKEEWETTTDVAVKYNMSVATISKYLKKGTNLGWCNYNPKVEKSIVSSRNGKSNGKKVCIFKDGKLLGTFKSCAELSRQSEELFGVKLMRRNISHICTTDTPYYKGFAFQYI